MEKAIKYIFIVLISFVMLFIIAVIIFFMMLGKEDERVDMWADKAMTEITSYYNKNGYYPKSLSDLPVSRNQEFVSHVQDNTFGYSSYSGDNPKYIFSWRTGAMSWAGYRCTNDESILNDKQDGVIRTYKTSFGAVCTVTDLH